MGKCCASYATSRDVARLPGASLVPAGASLAPGRGCVDCLNLIGQYNLPEPLRPITGLEIRPERRGEEREEREERRERELT